MKSDKRTAQEIERVREEERNYELNNIFSNIPGAVLEGILFSSIPAGVLTGIAFGTGLIIKQVTGNDVFQQPFFKVAGYGFAGSILDFIALGIYSSLPPNGGYEAIPHESAIDEIGESVRKRRELKNMTQEEIRSRYSSH